MVMLPIVVKFPRPVVLAKEENGKLDPSILGNTVLGVQVLRDTTARGVAALVAAADAAGIDLKITGIFDGYRTYAQQVALFLDRYTKDITKALRKPDGSILDARTWDGAVWYRYRGASAAVPGTSNHGWGLALDIGEEYDDDPWADPLRAATLSWLIANAESYGFSWELQSEPWHIRWVVGDQIPAAVLAYEAGQLPPVPPQPDPVPPQEVVLKDMPTLKMGAQGNPVVTLQSLLIQRGIWSDKPANRDGVFGSGTDAGVRKFQQLRGLVVDGIVGDHTWAALGHA